LGEGRNKPGMAWPRTATRNTGRKGRSQIRKRNKVLAKRSGIKVVRDVAAAESPAGSHPIQERERQGEGEFIVGKEESTQVRRRNRTDTSQRFRYQEEVEEMTA